MDILVDLQNISAAVQNQTALQNVSLQISKGKHLAIIGPSGSGKTSLLRIVAHALAITKGDVVYHRSLGTERNPAAHVALIESRHHFKNASNTTDFYYQQRYNSSDSEDAQTVTTYLQQVAWAHPDASYWTFDKVVEKLNLTYLLDKQLIKLSNGETKRLRIASALLKHPVILLLDQPLTGLDVTSREYFNNLLQEISASGITIVLTTSPAEIPAVTETVLVMENGSITQVLEREAIKTERFQWANSSHSFDAQEVNDLMNQHAFETFEDIIRMQNVNIRYGEVQVLKNINWTVKQGERWALLGHNGAGKSTLLSLVYGDNPQAYANDIVLFDRKRGSGESIWDIKKRSGFMSPELFQYFPLDQNCLQVIESGYYHTLGLFRRSDPKKAELAERWMKLFNIWQHRLHLLKNIPASAQRLCLLIRAIIKNPALLILDEPCQGMDNLQQQFFKQVIDTICRNSNITLIYVTHYMEELPEAVTKQLKLVKGEVVE
ncbi:ATP-binding cassette domain-containing protein [Mucilaginibacter sp. RS28]|uniref:ATP-binding cassette domain-containing protein n=1 Tax=Mucilaginibacter straminoryzae TaxID=2932774 RepID=A0A9X2BC34_9SPHI|nr:ATP-binding cassette domain-containing protein [Mucilaginibacter straminoryzae]MCJ8208893.1 ATP-binding cassette domain-containing protein [Mucilaginibacter straminoryzae]